MSQPIWKLVAQLGDVNPIDHGGYFVYEDTTGVYPPEAELLRNHDDDGEDGPWTVFRFSLDRCTFIDGVLSDNPYHPGLPAWFATPYWDDNGQHRDTAKVARFIGAPESELIEDLCSEDIVRRALAYQAIGDYHGFIEFDQYPISDFDRSQLEARYADHAEA